MIKPLTTDKINAAVSAFSEYVDKIQEIISKLNTDCSAKSIRTLFNSRIPAILNGKTTEFLEKIVPVSIRKEAGIFFTGTSLAENVAIRLSDSLSRGSTIFDPACGAGNLLIGCARYLPRGNTLMETLSIWDKKIAGCDLHPSFIHAAKLRLILLAATYHALEDITPLPDPNSVLKQLIIKDSLQNQQKLSSAGCIVVNPPFGHTVAPKDCLWSNGKIQLAGLFIAKLLQNAPDGQRIVAILPDVLRSGTRYKRWRQMVIQNCYSLNIETVGKFDNQTDVDVFILDGVKGKTTTLGIVDWNLTESSNPSDPKIRDYFDVHVGTVVPHRHSESGESYPYIHARSIKDWKTVNGIGERRKFLGYVFNPPFVVVRRTSSPSDKHRCIGAIINEKTSVAVENHLIVLLPKDKSFKTCQKLVSVLDSPFVTDWLNSRIRCRHLTVSAFREIPLITHFERLS